MHNARRFLVHSQRAAVNRKTACLAAMAMVMAAATPIHADGINPADPNERGDGTRGAAAEQSMLRGPLPSGKAGVAAKAAANAANRKTTRSTTAESGADGSGLKSRSSNPIVLINRGGLTDAHITPPDTTGAVGTKRFIQLVNQKAAIYSHGLENNPPSTDRPRPIVSGTLNEL